MFAALYGLVAMACEAEPQKTEPLAAASNRSVADMPWCPAGGKGWGAAPCNKAEEMQKCKTKAGDVVICHNCIRMDLNSYETLKKEGRDIINPRCK